MGRKPIALPYSLCEHRHPPTHVPAPLADETVAGNDTLIGGPQLDELRGRVRAVDPGDIVDGCEA